MGFQVSKFNGARILILTLLYVTKLQHLLKEQKQQLVSWRCSVIERNESRTPEVYCFSLFLTWSEAISKNETEYWQENLQIY
jgi:hypothetical protein